MSPLLRESEWKFSGVKDEEVSACHDWEFSRTAVLESDPHYVHHENNSFAKYGMFPSAWPKSPFLKCRKDYREELAKRYHSAQGLYPLDFKHFFQNYNWDTPTEMEMIWRREGPDSLALFQIDWSFSDKNLRDSFEGWLKEKRRWLNEERPDIEQQEARGRGALRSQRKEDLEALGIYRIIKFHREIPVSRLISFYGDKLAKRFKADDAWSDAKSRASKALEAFR